MNAKRIALCLALGVLLAGVVFWTQGMQWWTILLALLLLACPIVVGWVIFEFRQEQGVGGGHERSVK